MGIESTVDGKSYQMLVQSDLQWFAEQLGWKKIDGFNILVKSIILNRGDMIGLATDILKEDSDETDLNLMMPTKPLYTGADLWLGDNYALSIFRDDDNLEWPFLQDVYTESFEDIINHELKALEKPPRTNGFMGVKNLFLYILAGGTRGIPSYAQSNIVAEQLYEHLMSMKEKGQ